MTTATPRGCECFFRCYISAQGVKGAAEDEQHVLGAHHTLRFHTSCSIVAAAAVLITATAVAIAKAIMTRTTAMGRVRIAAAAAAMVVRGGDAAAARSPRPAPRGWRRAPTGRLRASVGVLERDLMLFHPPKTHTQQQIHRSQLRSAKLVFHALYLFKPKTKKMLRA